MELKNKYIIYGPIDPATFELRYIGRSSSGLTRPKSHFNNSSLKLKDKVHCWIRSLKSSNKLPIIFVLEYFELINSDVNFWLNEREIAWISAAKEIGCNLLNLTIGGEGVLGFTQSEASKLKMSISKKNLNFIFTTEHREKIGQAFRGKKLSKEHIEKIKFAKRNISKETCEKISQSKIGKKYSEKRKQKMKERWLKIPEEVRKRISNGNIGNSAGSKPVKCLNDNKIFPSAKKAGDYYNIDPSSIGAVMKGKRKRVGQYKFIYYYE